MKKNKITIYMLPLRLKIFLTFIYLFILTFLNVPLIVLQPSIDPWYAIVLLVFVDLILLYAIWIFCFSAIVLEEDTGVLLLRDSWVRRIPIQDIRVITRDEYVFHRHKGGSYCRIEVELINKDKKIIHLSLPTFGSKQWLNEVDEKLAEMNQRVDDWYRVYRKVNKKH